MFGWIPEDFSEWEGEDSDSKLTVVGNRVEWNHADRTRVRFVSKNCGRETIGDFDHAFDVNITGAFAASKDHRGLLRFWECRNDWQSRIWSYAKRESEGADKWTIHFEQRNDDVGLWVFNGTHLFDFNATYYVKITRAAMMCRLQVYSDSSHVHLLEDSAGIQGVDKRYQYVWVCSTLCTPRNQENWSTGYIENLRMKPIKNSVRSIRAH